MSYIIEELTIDTYQLQFISDPYGASNPLTEWDHPGMQFHVSGRDSITTDTLAGIAGNALQRIVTTVDELYPRGFDVDEEIMRRYAKWRAIAGSPWQLFTGSGQGDVQGHEWDWRVLVDTTDWPGDIEAAVLSTMAEYQAWATGDVFGYVLNDPSGREIESVWGYYGFDESRQYVIDEATATARRDAEQRKNDVNLVGAGFVGLI